jgi:transcriptional regulator with XRE-family HTH domain
MTNSYETLTGRQLDTASFGSRETKVFSELLDCFAASPDWDGFSDEWQKIVSPVLAAVPAAQRTKHPLYLIAQDLEMRLGIAQGQVAPPDYRDYIMDRIEVKFGSRYKFCQETNIPQAFLSQVLSGKKDFSLDKLRQVAEALDLSIALLPLDELASATRTESAVLRKASALVANELTVLKNAHDHLKRIPDPTKRRRVVEKDRSLFETVLARVAKEYEKLDDAKFGDVIVTALADEIKRLTVLLNALRDEIAKVAESGPIVSRGGEPNADRASLSRV